MKTEKLLGGLGALFIVLAVIPVTGWILGLIGLVFLFVALRAYSKFYKDSGIFNNFLIGFILSLVGIVVALIMDIGSLLLLLYIIGILVSFFYRKSLKSLNRHTGENLFGLAGNFMLIGAVLSIILIGKIIWFFGLAGNFMLNVDVLSIILIGTTIIGTIIWFIGWILLAVAFFKLPEQV